MEETIEELMEKYKNMSPQELEAIATKRLDDILAKEDKREILKKVFIDLLLFGKAEFVYKEEQKETLP